MPAPNPAFTPLDPARWAEAQRLYEDEELAVAEVADRTGISRSALYRKIAAQGWGDDGSEADDAEERLRTAQPPARPVVTPSAALAARLQNFVAARVAALEAGAAKADRDPERTARAVTALVRAFGELEELRQKIALEPMVADAPPVRSLAELRDAVADRLIALRAQARRRAKAGGLARGGSKAAMRGVRTDHSVTIDEFHRRRRR